MAERRRYTAKERAKAVGIATVDGVTAAERVTGIPKETIHYWCGKPEYAQLRTTARETVTGELWVGIQIGVRELVQGIQGDAPLNHKADAFKALADRFALLSGEATERTESRDLTDRLDDHEAELLGDAIRAELARRADEASVVPALASTGASGPEAT